MLEMAESGGDYHPLSSDTLSIAQMKRESHLGTFEASDSLVIQIGCESLLEGQTIGTKIFDTNWGTKVCVFDVSLFSIAPESEVASNII